MVRQKRSGSENSQSYDHNARRAACRPRNSSRDNTMETKREILQRLEVAQRQTERAFLRDGLKPDLHPGTEIASAWPFVTAGYCGIEQTFKFLIANAKGMSVEELVAPNGNKKSASPFRTHDLHTLYEHLDGSAREILEDYYRILQSLHDYVDVPSLQDFLKIVSDPPDGKAGRGYENWRYSLTIPDARIPRNSPVFLLAIWYAAVAVADEREYDSSMLTPDRQIASWFYHRLESIMRTVHVHSQDRGLPYENYIEQYRLWVRSHGHPLNGFAAVLRDARRGVGPAKSGASGTLEKSLAAWSQSLHEGVTREANYNVRHFYERARGRRGGPGSIRWNTDKRVFEDEPWELAPRWANTPPPESFQFKGDRHGQRRDSVAERLRTLGLDLRENLDLSSPRPADGDEWLCTLEAKPTAPVNSDNSSCVVRVWESRRSLRDDTDFYVEVVIGDSEEGRRFYRLFRECSLNSGGLRTRQEDDDEGELVHLDDD